MLPSPTVHPPARTDHQDPGHITSPHNPLHPAGNNAAPQRPASICTAPEEHQEETLTQTGPGQLRLLFPFPHTTREDGPVASRWPAPCCSPVLCPSAKSPGAAQPLKPTPLRTQTLLCGCCAAFGIFFFPFPFFFFFSQSILYVQMPRLLTIQPGGVGSVLEHAQAVCSVRARCSMPSISSPRPQLSRAPVLGALGATQWGNLEPAMGTQPPRGHTHPLTLLLSQSQYYGGVL